MNRSSVIVFQIDVDGIAFEGLVPERADHSGLFSVTSVLFSQ